MPQRAQVAFVTVGQAPRSDIVPEMLGWLPPDLDHAEFGVLDGLDPRGVAALAPHAGEPSLCTRLADGSEVVTGKHRTADRLGDLIARLDTQGFAAIVLLCSGRFDGLSARTMLVEAQPVVDATVDALSAGRHLGVVLPLERQIAESHVGETAERRVTHTHYSPYSGETPSRAAASVAGCDLLIMHCMGYDAAMRAEMVRLTGKPVLLPRRIVASAVAQLI
ncbi:MAG: AroM family protein [Rhizobiaceae bacterium]